MNDHKALGGSSDQSLSEERIGRIMRKVRRETGMRDIVTFAIGNAWSVTLVGAAVFLAAVGAADRKGRQTRKKSQA